MENAAIQSLNEQIQHLQEMLDENRKVTRHMREALTAINQSTNATTSSDPKGNSTYFTARPENS